MPQKGREQEVGLMALHKLSHHNINLILQV